jgi:hypothetical protein
VTPRAGDGDAPVYGLHGLRLRSPVPLAGFPQPPEVHDVDVRWAPSRSVSGDPPPGRLVASAGTDGAYLYVAANDGGRWTLRVGGICDFVVDEGLDVVECRPDPAADPQLVAVLVAGLVVAFLLGLAGHCVLHASAVEVDGAGLAVAGPSGAGKSTLAALLCGGGARLVTDDVLRLDVSSGVACIGGSPQLRLRPGAAWALDRFAVAPSSGSTVDGRLSVAPPPSGRRNLSLSAIVLPRLSREARAIDLRPVTGAASVARLAAVCRVAGWRDPHVMRSQFRALTRVAAGVKVVEAVIPWGAPCSSAIVAALRALA